MGCIVLTVAGLVRDGGPAGLAQPHGADAAGPWVSSAQQTRRPRQRHALPPPKHPSLHSHTNRTSST